MASKKASKKSARRSQVKASPVTPARGKKQKVVARRGSSAASPGRARRAPGAAARKSPKNAGAITGGVMLYVEDVDAVFQRALDEGAKGVREPTDEFWGDRFAQLEDPFGHVWSMATHVRDVSPEEMRAAMSQMPPAEG
jgi:hypothetical protein